MKVNKVPNIDKCSKFIMDSKAVLKNRKYIQTSVAARNVFWICQVKLASLKQKRNKMNIQIVELC